MNDEDIADAINGLWIFVAGVLCFLMQAGEWEDKILYLIWCRYFMYSQNSIYKWLGFGLLEVGSIRAKNAQNVLLKNIMVRYSKFVWFSYLYDMSEYVSYVLSYFMLCAITSLSGWMYCCTCILGHWFRISLGNRWQSIPRKVLLLSNWIRR